MTDKERLEEIKKNANTYKFHDFITELIYDDYLWLVEQVEKKTELEQSYRRTISKQNKQITALREKNQRYKQLIEKAMKELDWGDPSNAIEKAKLILAVASKGESDATRALEVKQDNPGQGWF